MARARAVLARAEAALDLAAGLFAVLGGIALALLMAITVVAVGARYALNDPIFGIEDVSTMGLTIVVAAAIAYGAHHGAHISVNVISGVAGRRVTRLTDVLARALSVAILGVATYALFKHGACGLPCGAITNNLGIVHTPFYYALGAAMGLYTLLLAVQLGIGLLHWDAPEDPNELGA